MRNALPLLIAAVLPVPARAAQNETTQMQARIAIQRAYNAIDTAFEQRNLDAADTYFAPQYVRVDKDGKRTDKADARTHNADLLSKVKALHATTQVLRLSLSKGSATVTTQQSAEITAEARILFVRKTVHVQSKSRTRDLWVQTPQGWRMTESRALSDTATVDGSPSSNVPAAR